jgi:hypothetical protein
VASEPLLRPILDDEALTRGLGDEEARVLVEWLVEAAEQLAQSAPPAAARVAVERLHRRGRAVSRFVRLWCHDRSPGAAAQLAAAERFGWPLPGEKEIDPCELMLRIMGWECLKPAA